MNGFSGEQIDRIAVAGRTERLARGGRIVFDGGAAVVVVEGWLRVFRDAAFVRDVTLALAGRGDLLAGGALFEERAAESGAVALGPAVCAWIGAAAFAELAAGDPGLLLAAARNLARRTAAVGAKLERMSRAPAEARVAATLCELAAEAGRPLPGGAIGLGLPLSQSDLAELAGTTRETASTTLAGFVRRGVIGGTRLADLTILDPAALEAAADAQL